MAETFNPSLLFQKVERARRRKPKVKDTHITLAHGSGGRAMHELVEGLFLEYLGNPLLEQLEDQAVFEIAHPDGGRPSTKNSLRLAYTTDSYVVDTSSPRRRHRAFRHARSMTVREGARPLTSRGLIRKKGFHRRSARYLSSVMPRTSRALIITGDTKVVQRGSADKVFIIPLQRRGESRCESPIARRSETKLSAAQSGSCTTSERPRRA